MLSGIFSTLLSRLVNWVWIVFPKFLPWMSYLGKHSFKLNLFSAYEFEAVSIPFCWLFISKQSASSFLRHMVETFMANPYLCTFRLKGREGSGYLFNFFWNIFGGSESRTFMWGQCWLSRTSTGLWKLGNSSGLPGISLAQSREKTKQNKTSPHFSLHVAQ